MILAYSDFCALKQSIISYPESCQEVRSEVVVDADQERFSTRNKRHACCHEANHVMGRGSHPRLFRVQCKILYE